MKDHSTGPYVQQAFHFNLKCVIFSIIMMVLYWITPCNKNMYILPVIFVAAYIAMGWYDSSYNCDISLLSGSSYPGAAMIDSIFKPQNLNKSKMSEEDQKDLLPQDEQQKIYLRNVYLFHIMAVVPLLSYIGYYGKKADERSFGALLGITGIAGAYHLGRLFYPRI